MRHVPFKVLTVIQVPMHSRFEAIFESSLSYDNPVQDVRVMVEFTFDSEAFQVDAFWDGENCWRVRFAPQRMGRWSWRTHCTRQDDRGLDDEQGEFDCCASQSQNDWLTHGPLQISSDKRHLEYADGTPFFWLADTAWNGPLKSSDADWDVYLADRRKKGFSVIQCVATQWLGAATDAEGRRAYSNPLRIQIEPAFFQRLDRRIDRIDDFGFVAAPVLAWAATWSQEGLLLNPGTSLSEDQIVVLVRYIVSRYGAQPAVWILSGDSTYIGAEAERWRQIGRAALANSPRLATVHPSPRLWVDKEFEGEPWYSLNGYQSGQFNDAETARWINRRARNPGSAMPTIDLEPCYEGHLPLETPGAEPMDALSVRRACYWSLLAGPVAGVSYGAHGVWSWEESPTVPLNHPGAGLARPWWEAIAFPGSGSMAHLGAVFNSIPWWRLDPRPQLLQNQPGADAPLAFVAAACSPERDLAVVYAPEGGAVSIRPGALIAGLEAHCIDPATGTELWMQQVDENGWAFDCGAGGDRLLLFHLSTERNLR